MIGKIVGIGMVTFGWVAGTYKLFYLDGDDPMEMLISLLFVVVSALLGILTSKILQVKEM